jgi:DNA (cytosine-5)-methyltransferase 1
MGVPQRRERVFFVCRKKELAFKDLKLNFNEQKIYYKEIEDNCFENQIAPSRLNYYDAVKPGKVFSTQHEKKGYYNTIKQHPYQIVNTIANGSSLVHYREKRQLSNNELILASSFPLDYDFCGTKPIYILGMSVPPVMTANVAYEIYLQWFKK